ncbi:protoporphyrinogen/coproporphyrinogen oxidase [Streptomyces profundus]|uniref:protoporphyrinogen/coproporphyrinogen oxidase n=1 Tax=Streptomyces profundus TaxID=2867410 RepID=UPI001D1636DD|nr:FAD-dependent oxidoreductase [Streptomyces sp. MA3_2.13]
MPKPKRVAVVGGGMSGTAAARELIQAGREVTLFDTAEALGGRARSWHRPEISPDTGINLWFLTMYKTLFERIREYKLEDDMVEMKNSMIIVANGKQVPLASDSVRSLLSYPHTKLGDRLRFLTTSTKLTTRRKKLDLFEPEHLARVDDGTNAADWASKAMSPDAFQYLIRPLIESFWLWRCDEISQAHVMGMLANVVGSKFYVFGRGMETVAERMAKGATLRLGTSVTEVAVRDGGEVVLTFSEADGSSSSEAFDEVVIATTAPVAAKLAAPLPSDIADPEMVRFADSQRYEPALSVSYLIDRGLMPSNEHIVPGGPGTRIVRSIITVPKTHIDGDERREKELTFVYMGRQATKELLGAPEEQQYERALELAPELWPDFPQDAEPFHIVERRVGLPWPEPGRYVKAAALARNQHGPVVFAGDFLANPTAEGSMRTGIRAANSLLAKA